MFLDINLAGIVNYEEGRKYTLNKYWNKTKTANLLLKYVRKPSGCIFKECFLKSNLGENH